MWMYMQSSTQNVRESSSVPFSSQNSSSHRHYARLWAQCMSTCGLQQGYKIVKGLVYWATRPPHLLSSWSTPWIVHHPLSNSQWGSQKRKSTTTALLSTTHQWLIALEQGKEFCAFSWIWERLLILYPINNWWTNCNHWTLTVMSSIRYQAT